MPWPAAPLSVYVHLPFCEERCAFCGCNVVITPHRDVADRYLDALDAGDRPAGASTCPTGGRCRSCIGAAARPPTTRRRSSSGCSPGSHDTSSSTPDAEVGLEIDPRVTSGAQLTALRRLGFNRLSMGVQDFTPEVQEAVNRIQSYEQTRALVDHARALGFTSLNIDLIYGLPYQTEDGFQQTLDQVVELRPDRVAVYSFAFVPWMAAHMKRLPAEALPGPALKLALLAAGPGDAFGGAGYRQIGMDHFALPDDELGRALEARTLHRNFMGYTVQSARDMVALGVSGIGDVQGAFVQNTKKLPEYYDAVDAGRFPIERGYALDDDDALRRYVITALMCNGRVDIARGRAAVRHRLRRATSRPSSPSWRRRDRRRRMAWSRSAPTRIEVTPVGRMFVRNVCMVFDRYLRAPHRGRDAGVQPHGMSAPRVVVVGAGVTGLAAGGHAAPTTAARAGVPLALRILEAAPRVGGHVQSTCVDGFVIEAGPNGFLNREPQTLALIERLGLTLAAGRGAIRGQAALHRARRRPAPGARRPGDAAHVAGAVVARQAAPARRAVRRRAAAPARSRCTPSRPAGWGAKSPTCSSTPPSAASPPATAGGCRSRRSFPGWWRWSARTAACSERCSPGSRPAPPPGRRSS